MVTLERSNPFPECQFPDPYKWELEGAVGLILLPGDI